MQLIVLTGMPASGKSRLAGAVQAAFSYPLLEKDRIKEELFDTLGFRNYAEKRALDHAANAVLLQEIETLLKNGDSVIVDNNFDVSSAARLMELVKAYGPEMAVVELTGDPQVFYERYIERDGAAKRHPGHALQDHYPLREGEKFSFSMTREEFDERFIARGMNQAAWAPERISVNVTEREVPRDEIVEMIRRKLEEQKKAKEEGPAPAVLLTDKKPIVAFPFRSFPELIGEEGLEEWEAAGLAVRANRSGARLSREDMSAMLDGAFAVVAGGEKYDAELLKGAGDLQVIIRLGVGLDNIDLAAVKERNIRLGVIDNAYAVAEHTLMLMLSLLKEQPIRERELREGRWNHEMLEELRGKTVGLLGFGRIGKRLAGLLWSFHVRLLAYDPYFDEAAGRMLNVKSVSFEELLAKSDILSLHLPGTKENENMIGTETIAKMKPGARLINAARGSLVDEKALCEALQSGRLAGAALDAFKQEPPAADSPLLKAPHLILSPHVAALTKETNRMAARTALHSILSVLSGGEPDYPVRL